MELLQIYIALSARFPDHAFSLTDVREIKERGLNVNRILQARIDYMTKGLNVKNWVPSSPTSPPRYNLSITGRNGAITGLGSLELYPLSWLFGYLSNGREVNWVSPTCVRLNDEIELRSDYLEDIAEYEMRGDEKLWHPEEPYASQWARLASGEAPAVKAPRKEREAKPERPQKGKPTGEVVTLADLCAELGIEGGKARQKLRVKNIAKPYAWTKDEVNAIKEILK